MSDQIVLVLPDDISARARLIAEATSLSIEQVLLDYLKTLFVPELPPAEQAELVALHHLSDDALWTISREQLPDEVQTRAHELMGRNSRGTITEQESLELDMLVERGDRVMLRKAEAASILKSRGYAFTQIDFLPRHE